MSSFGLGFGVTSIAVLQNRVPAASSSVTVVDGSDATYVLELTVYDGADASYTPEATVIDGADTTYTLN